jgi:hypothetical protein
VDDCADDCADEKNEEDDCMDKNTEVDECPESLPTTRTNRSDTTGGIRWGPRSNGPGELEIPKLTERQQLRLALQVTHGMWSPRLIHCVVK